MDNKSLAGMDVIQAIQDYITKMISNIPGMKVFLLDDETMGIVSMVYTLSQVLQKEVFLFELLRAPNRSPMHHLKAVCFLRPTAANRDLLTEEFKNPRYGEYHLYFSNTLPHGMIEELARADEMECVHGIQEFYADYYAINHDLLSLNMPPVVTTQQNDWPLLQERIVEGLGSIVLSLKKQPVIRYSARSDMCERVVKEFQRKIKADQAFFDFRKSEQPPLLLIYDRKDDPITPLLTQWTYQAMVHELLGLENNQVVVKTSDKKEPTARGVPKGMDKVVLSCLQDEWFKKTMFNNFGDLGVRVKEELVDDYQAKTKSNQKIESMEDIKRFVEEYPDFRKLAGHVTKHVTLMGELSRLVTEKALLSVSEVEQSLACETDHSDHVNRVRDMLEGGTLSSNEMLKLVLLYAIRYEDYPANEIDSLRDVLHQQTKMFTPKQLQAVDAILRYGGKRARSGELFAAKGSITNVFRELKKGLKGVENIYTQHKPYLKTVLEQIITGRLRETDYAFAGSQQGISPRHIIVFIVGGATYEEACTVHEFNQINTPNAPRIVLAGTKIHNSKSFINDLGTFQETTRG